MKREVYKPVTLEDLTPNTIETLDMMRKMIAAKELRIDEEVACVANGLFTTGWGFLAGMIVARGGTGESCSGLQIRPSTKLVEK